MRIALFEKYIDLYKNKKYSPWNELWLGVFTIAISTYLLVWNNCFLFSYMGDIYIPHLSIAAIKQGLAFHSEFHSQFGWVYHYFYYLTDRVIAAWPGLLTISSLIPLASSLFSVGILAIFIAINAYSPSDKKLPAFLLFIALLMCLSQRLVEEPSFDYITQSGTYNNNNMAFLFLQVFLCSLWQDFLLHGKSVQPAKHSLRALYLLQVFFLYFFFNYKVTLFVASAALTGSILFLLPPRERWPYVFWISGLFAAAIAITAIAGYDYAGYMQDLWTSLIGRKKANLGPYTLLPAPALLLIIALELSRRPVYTKADAFAALKDYSNVFFCFCLAVATLAVTLGISSRPNVYTVMIGAMLICSRLSLRTPIPDRQVGYGLRIYFWNFLSLLILGYFVLLNILSSLYVYYANISHTDKLYKTHIGNILFSVPTFNKEKELDKIFEKDKTDIAQEQDRIEKFLKKEDVLPPFSMQFFAKQYEDIVDVMTPLGLTKDVKDKTFFYVGYINPMPVILGSKIPAGSYHWLHTTITVGVDDIAPIIINGVTKSDIVVTPFYGIFEDKKIFESKTTRRAFLSMHQKMQTDMNCDFYTYNRESGYPFKPFKVTKYNTYWAKDDFMRAHKLSSQMSSPRLKNEMSNSCRNAAYFRDLINGKLPAESNDSQ